MCDVFLCFVITFSYRLLGQAWCLIIAIPDLCILPYFVDMDINRLSRYFVMICIWLVVKTDD